VAAQECKGIQNMKHLRFARLALSATTLALSSLAHSAAFQLYELGTPVVGTAGVGQAVITTDASTAYFNPAGMSALPTSQLMLGPQVILPYTNFSPNSSTTIVGNNGGSAGSLTPAIGAYYVYSYSPKLKAGISFTSPYGGALNYNDHWVGRYNVQQLVFYTLNLNPALAYQVNNWISVGAGASIEYAYLNQSLALRVTPLVDGQATLKVDNTSPGFNLGLLLAPRPATKVGVAYRSQIVHNLHGNIDFLNISSTPGASTKMTMPSNIIASISQQMNDKFTLLGEAGWANWSSMTNSAVTVDGYTATTIQNWHDTYRVGLAGQYQLYYDLLLHAGASYDSSPTSSSRRTPELPMDRQIRIGAGLAYYMVRDVTLGVSYEYINFGNASINNSSPYGVFAGSYSRNFANVFQASLNVAC
jgi:long-chain fatty acid transport protein